MPPKLVALKAFPYGRLKLTPGQTFDAQNAHDYRLLTMIGHARAASADEPVTPDPHVTIPDAISGPPAASERVVVPPGEEARPMTTQTIRQKPGKYKRKDLEAES